jgi:plastocyanin
MGAAGLIVIAIIAVVLNDSANTQATGTPVASPGASPSPAASPSPVSLAGHGSATVSREVTIELTDEGYVPNYVQSTSGHDLTVTLVNSGSRPHGFAIERLDIDVQVGPGETRTVVVHPSAGEGDFTYVSNAPGDTGMEGTLTFYI